MDTTTANLSEVTWKSQLLTSIPLKTVSMKFRNARPCSCVGWEISAKNIKLITVHNGSITRYATADTCRRNPPCIGSNTSLPMQYISGFGHRQRFLHPTYTMQSRSDFRKNTVGLPHSSAPCTTFYDHVFRHAHFFKLYRGYQDTVPRPVV